MTDLTHLHNLWPYSISCTRWLSFFLILPGTGELFIPAKIRLLLALSLSMCITPTLVQQTLIPATVSMEFFAGELFVGLFLGILVRIFVELASTSGSFISHQIAFSNVMSSLVQTEQQDIMKGFLYLFFVNLVFTNDLHFIFLKSIYQSYTLFPPGGSLFLSDMTTTVIRWVRDGFQVAVEMSTPFFICSLFYYGVLGLLNRLIPQIPLFFVGRPLEIAVGLMVFLTALMPMSSLLQGQIMRLFNGFLG